MKKYHKKTPYNVKPIYDATIYTTSEILTLHIYFYAEYTRIPFSFCAQFICWNHHLRCYLCLLSSFCHLERILQDFL